MSRKILIIGSGAREHSIAYSLSKDDRNIIAVCPGNGGTATISVGNKVYPDDMDKLAHYISLKRFDLVVIGPEKPLSEGIVNLCYKRGNHNIFGPTSEAAKLETSKIYGKIFCRSHDIKTAAWTFSSKQFQNAKEAIEFANIFANSFYGESEKGEISSCNLVIKLDRLAGGKGVFLPENHSDLVEILGRYWNEALLFEKRLSGREFSAMAFCDGEVAICMPFVQDYKRLYNGSKGPNTGGMGAYAPVDWIPLSVKRKVKFIMQKVISGMEIRGISYKGILFAGFMYDSYESSPSKCQEG